MTRSLNAAMLADIRLDTAEKTELLELRFAAATTYITTASQDLSWNGHTWQAVGGHMVVEGFGESIDESNNGCRVTMSGVDQALIAQILGAVYRGRKALVYYAHFNPATGQVIANPLTMFDGYMNDSFLMDEIRTPEGAGSCTISTKFTDRISEVSKIRGVRTNVHSHQRAIPGASDDTFFQHVPSLLLKRIYWGIRSPNYISPPAGPGNTVGSTPGQTGPGGGGTVNPGPAPGSAPGGTTPGGTGGTAPSAPPPTGGGGGWGSTPGSH